MTFLAWKSKLSGLLGKRTRTKAVAFLFMDECHSSKLNIAALTGLLVPMEKYNAVRDDMASISWEVLNPAPNQVPQPVELHGSDLLRELGPGAEADRLRLHVLSRAVELVNSQRLHVRRIAYTNHREIARKMKGDPKLYGLTFLGLQWGLQKIMADTLLIPVMDGIPGWRPGQGAPAIDPQLIRAFAQQVRFVHHIRQHQAASGFLSIENAANLAEPVFADSAHSTLLQLVDLISYLLHQLEKHDLGSDPVSAFGQASLQCARAIDDSLLSVWQGPMEFHEQAG